MLPLGVAKARDITYRNLDLYLVTSSGYFDAREGSIRAAEDLYGSCSNEVLQTARAWYAVGVATASPDWDFIAPCTVIVGDMKGINTISTSGSCATTILSTPASSFSATQSVTLKPGFTAPFGCTFTAYLNSCNEAAFNFRSSVDNNSQIKIGEQESVLLKINSVSPNPANNYAVIEYQSTDDVINAQFAITDLTGRITDIKPDGNISSGEFKKVKVDITHLANGLYIFFVKDKTGTANVKMIISR